MEILILCSFFGLGAVLASFVGVIAERINTGQSWKHGRSRCNSCAEELTTADLIPVFSWVLARGRCRRCGSRIPLLYVVVEALTGTIFALGYLKLGLSLPLIPFLGAVLSLLFISLYDLRHTIVPMSGWVMLLVCAVLYQLSLGEAPYMLGLALLNGGLIGVSFFFLFAFSRGRAMGLGDAPIALALSVLVAPYAFTGLLFSFWVGAVIGIAILVLRRGGPTMGIEVPFVPFLAAGYLLAFFTQWNPLGLM